ncbi:DUF1330 domain-containing protein [Streptomyces sp. DSM 44915]|uniref:DUF1330 domain-containing protein n=1 Tax=Streptomyces chisholmiae TaxID=3075540 RepID=A0ABU2JM63_9ACTN|nr:DUF1330 domain-containing protein [Streptomyces sp. DSM 44915]MDT0265343.1 DUF1330 domain-containing protein [Streptomyces sp. DSM 44915]
MTAYALARLQPTAAPHPDVATYIERIQETFEPFGGRFLVHGVTPERIEGEWEGDVVLVAFPDLAAAHAWYASPAYQEILPLRTAHLPGELIFLPGVPAGYDAATTAAALRAALPA